MTFFPKAPAPEAGKSWALRRLIERTRRVVTAARARQSLDEVDTRTLRDIGLTRQEALFLSFGRSRT
jgi:uncharacterized protein YjiS (DUF1127 family)